MRAEEVVCYHAAEGVGNEVEIVCRVRESACKLGVEGVDLTGDRCQDFVTMRVLGVEKDVTGCTQLCENEQSASLVHSS